MTKVPVIAQELTLRNPRKQFALSVLARGPLRVLGRASRGIDGIYRLQHLFVGALHVRAANN
jgi:hypothetical protein